MKENIAPSRLFARVANFRRRDAGTFMSMIRRSRCWKKSRTRRRSTTGLCWNKSNFGEKNEQQVEYPWKKKDEWKQHGDTETDDEARLERKR